MNKIIITQVYDDYNPINPLLGEPTEHCYHQEGGPWTTLEDVQGRFLVALEHYTSKIQPGDKLTLSIEIQSKEIQSK